jgi:hypothetical protein
VNWPQNDYWLGNLYGVSEEEAARHLKRGKNSAARCSTGCRPKRRARRRRRLARPAAAPDLMGTEDGLGDVSLHPRVAAHPRRVHRDELHVGTEARMKATGKPREEVTAPSPSTTRWAWAATASTCTPRSGGDNYIDVSSLPFQIPLGALLPKRVENLLPACKNLGRHPHHQRLLPAASGGVEHRRIGGRAGVRTTPGIKGRASRPLRPRALALRP